MRLHGHTLSETVLLKLPSGAVSRIGLEKRNGKVWLRNGWPRFTESYAIVRGHMLVFKYHGNSEFSLVIFNDTTYEVDYPLPGDQRCPEKGETSMRRGEGEEGPAKSTKNLCPLLTWSLSNVLMFVSCFV